MPATKEKLQVRIGPDPENLTVAVVNDAARPHFIQSEHFTGRVFLRIRDFAGVSPSDQPTPSPTTSPYFTPTRKRRFSLVLQGRFSQEFDAGEVVFGAVFDKPVKPPWGAGMALKAAQLIDGAIRHDLGCSTPWVLSPLACGLHAINSTKAPEPTSAASTGTGHSDETAVSSGHLTVDTEKVTQRVSRTSLPSDDAMLGHWELRDEDEVKEDMTLLWDQTGGKVPPVGDGGARRGYFRNSANRAMRLWQQDTIYTCELYAPYLDLNTFNLDLGLKLSINPYLAGQPLRLFALGRRRTVASPSPTPRHLSTASASSPTAEFFDRVVKRMSSTKVMPDPVEISARDNVPPRAGKEDGKKTWWDGVIVLACLEFSLV
ncbi:hypothetical protein HDU93_000451 [Gonapodya sp. JEL0774]|nr:hypothetical protein HDU93_000451 [Gonapodya sp. JEL0774]